MPPVVEPEHPPMIATSSVTNGSMSGHWSKLLLVRPVVVNRDVRLNILFIKLSSQES